MIINRVREENGGRDRLMTGGREKRRGKREEGRKRRWRRARGKERDRKIKEWANSVGTCFQFSNPTTLLFFMNIKLLVV